MTHAQLVSRAERWLLNQGCWFVLRELPTINTEIPDAIGWLSGAESVLVECKSTRADFLADRKKDFRVEPASGMGSYRWFLCPPEVASAADVPEGWGLLHCHPRQVRRVVEAPLHHARAMEAEVVMLSTALRRVHLRGRLEEIYSLKSLRGEVAPRPAPGRSPGG